MKRNFGVRPTIELEPLPHDGVWVVKKPVPPTRLAPYRRRGGITFVMAAFAVAATALAGAAVLLTSQASWAQAPAWRPIVAGDTLALRDAIVAGAENGLPLYLCRAAYGGGTLVGRYRTDFGGCHIGYDGKEVEATPFEVLGSTWTDLAEAPAGKALAAGEMADGPASKTFASRSAFACRVNYQGAVHLGTWPAPDKSCTFGFGGRVIVSQNFSVLQSVPWMTWSPGVPSALTEGALVGGEEGGEPLFLCRAQTPRGLLAGKVKASSPGCSVPFDGREMVVSRFEVLTPRWLAGNSGSIPVGAVVGGREKTELQFLCRGRSRNTMQPGRISEQRSGCRVGMQGSEVILQEYDVLSQ